MKCCFTDPCGLGGKQCDRHPMWVLLETNWKKKKQGRSMWDDSKWDETARWRLSAGEIIRKRDQLDGRRDDRGMGGWNIYSDQVEKNSSASFSFCSKLEADFLFSEGMSENFFFPSFIYFPSMSSFFPAHSSSCSAAVSILPEETFCDVATWKERGKSRDVREGQEEIYDLK